MKSSIQFGDITIEYDVIYSKRKTLEISIKPPGIITVRVPNYLSEAQIENSVRNKGKWIMQKLHILSKQDAAPINREYVSGETFMYMGRYYELKVVLEESLIKPEVKLDKENVILTTPTNDKDIMRQLIESWYKQKALETITKRIEYYGGYFKLKPSSIKIKNQKTRWGSCNYKNDLCFNYKLIMAPCDVLDYVVVHEMCHMEHKNHSKNFWNEVASIIPDYSERRQWLKEHGVRIDI